MENIPVVCHTNLDLIHERWPISMPQVPSVGQKIMSNTYWNDFRLKLEVVDITWEYDVAIGNWVPLIELHIPKDWNMTITDFYNWYAPKVGKSPSAFI